MSVCCPFSRAGDSAVRDPDLDEPGAGDERTDQTRSQAISQNLEENAPQVSTSSRETGRSGGRGWMPSKLWSLLVDAGTATILGPVGPTRAPRRRPLPMITMIHLQFSTFAMFLRTGRPGGATTLARTSAPPAGHSVPSTARYLHPR